MFTITSQPRRAEPEANGLLYLHRGEALTGVEFLEPGAEGGVGLWLFPMLAFKSFG